MNEGTSILRMFVVVDGTKQKVVWAQDADDAISKTKSSSDAIAMEVHQERN